MNPKKFNELINKISEQMWIWEEGSITLYINITKSYVTVNVREDHDEPFLSGVVVEDVLPAFSHNLIANFYVSERGLHLTYDKKYLK